MSLALVLSAAAWRQVEALRLPFLADDYLFLDQVRGRSLLPALLSRDPLENYVRPVGRQLYFWVVTSLGASPAVAHALNLGAFVLIVALVFAITRRLTGTRAATIGAAIVALHYAADVPVRWASGSQDLLAILGALVALWLFLSGRRLASVVALLAALLSKETVALTPVIAALAARQPGEPWRRTATRAWPLFAAVGLWALFWLATIHRNAVAQLSESPASLLAALLHLPQVLVGAEWRPGGRIAFLDSPSALGPVALALAAGALAWRPTAEGGRGAASAVAIGATWAIAGTLPVTAVAPTWNAYYYLFALCGVALAAGALLARAPLPVALLAVLALASGSEHARRLDQFATAPGVWNAQSHLNRFYFDRAAVYVNRYLSSLRRAHPTLPQRSTLFFSNVAPMVAWQGGDGALLRWAYRDSTIRSYYLSSFSLEAARRGPVFVFDSEADTLEDITWHPQLFMELGMSLLTADHFHGADDALALELSQHPDNSLARYWKGWTRISLGDTAGGYRLLAGSGCLLEKGPTPQLLEAEARVAAGDTLGAEARLEQGVMHHMLDSEAHAALADFEMRRRPLTPVSAMEAFAARTLDPASGSSWRRWALVQYSWGNYAGALESLERYFALAGPDSRRDGTAVALSNFLRRRLPGGDVAQAALRAK